MLKRGFPFADAMARVLIVKGGLLLETALTCKAAVALVCEEKGLRRPGKWPPVRAGVTRGLH